MLDLTKPVETRDSLPARILCTDSRVPDYPVVGLIQLPSGNEIHASWTTEGKYNTTGQHPYDLCQVPPATHWSAKVAPL